MERLTCTQRPRMRLTCTPNRNHNYIIFDRVCDNCPIDPCIPMLGSGLSIGMKFTYAGGENGKYCFQSELKRITFPL